jgi:hypothetical protein
VTHALSIDKFGENSEIFGLGEEIHSARGLQTTLGGMSRNDLDT